MNINATTNQREEEILRELRDCGGSCRVKYLSKRLNVTQETIRRNLKSLGDAALVRKVHGGVHLVHGLNEATFQNRMDTQAAIKQRLARTVAASISDGDSVFLDVGSTTAYVALALKDRKNLYIVTNSVFVAQTLATHNNNRVFLAGGELRPHDGGAFGAEALDMINRLNVEFAILSAGAINAESGLMLHDLEEANIARVAARNAQVRIVAAVSDKFGKRAPIVADFSKAIDILVTDHPPPDEIFKTLKCQGTEVIVSKG